MNQKTPIHQEIENQAALTTDLLKLFLHVRSRKVFLEKCLKNIRDWADLSGVGIRVLDTLGNIPYQAYSGFNAQFIKSEKWLSTLEDDCLCIRVAKNRLLPKDLTLSSAAGSFSCNDTQSFVNELNKSEKKDYRGICILHGYTSLAVIPIRYRNHILGVLHLVDSRAGAFPPQTINFLETSVASILGEGIYRFGIEERLQQNLDTQTVLTRLLKTSLEDLTLENTLYITLDLIHSYKPLSKEKKGMVYLSTGEPAKMKLAAYRNLDENELIRFADSSNCPSACHQAVKSQKLVYGLNAQSSENPSRLYAIPIIYQKNTVGVICLCLGKNHHRDKNDEHFLIALANTVSGIIWRKRSESMLRRLSLRMVSVQEEERRGIALELHDQIGQMLTGLKLMIGQAIRSNEKVRLETLQEAQEAVTELIVNVREMSLNLRPSMLDDLGLLPTLIWHFQRCKSRSNLNVDFRHSGLDVPFSKDVAIAAYRIVQEALTNVMRYAGVEEVLVEIWIDQDWLQIRIEDKGKGFRTQDIPAGSSLGLQGMRERAMLLGGSLTIDSQPGQGTVVFAQMPLNIDSENVTISGK